MKKNALFFLTLFIALLSYKPTNLKAQTEKLPPLIDREIFFGNPEIAGAQLSPDGKYMSFIKPYEEVRNIWIKKTSEPFENASPLTADKRPIPGYFWTHDSKYILYVQDKGGNENFHVYAVNPSEAMGGKMPQARDLTPVEGIRAAIYAVPESDPDLMYVGFNDRDAAWHDLYKVNISTGKRELIRENTEKIAGWTFDQNYELKLALRTTDDGGTEVLRVDKEGFTPVYSCNNEETCYPVRYYKDNQWVYMVTNKGATDLTQLVSFDPQTGETKLIETDPEGMVDFGNAVFSDVSKDLIATTYTGDKTRIYFKDKSFEADYNYIKKELPGVEISLGSSTKDENLFLVYANSDTDPGAAYLYDRKTRKLTFQYRPRPKLPVGQLANMTPVRYKSLDGLEIPAYLTLPKYGPQKNIPVIIHPHGGPWARDTWGYDSYAQFWANRGYAVLQPNFRGSTGYGKAFLNAGNLEWGQKMQDDLTAGAMYLIDEGIADPEKVGIFGGSYGGYATLAGLTFTPDVYAAGISIVGPSNLITLLESIPPYWEAGRKLFHKRMGNPETKEGKALMIKQSPLFSVDMIKTPLLVVQGANDPRVKKAESDQIVVAMRELGLPVEYIVAPDEGHGFRDPENNMAFIAAAEKFFARHLGGRYQKEMPDNIAKKLEAITVDVKTVKMPEKADASKLNSRLPSPAFVPEAGTFKYKMTIKMGGQEIPMEVTRTVKEDGKDLIVQDVAQTPMGNIEDKSVLQKSSLQPLMREVNQGPIKIVLNHSENKIDGIMSLNGNEQTIAADLEQPVFGDGAALDLAFASLPLKEGYSAVYRTFDVQTQKVRPFELKVVGVETLEVPAGKYETFVVEVKALDGGSGEKMAWINTSEPRCVVKSSAVVMEMGGATVITELSAME